MGRIVSLTAMATLVAVIIEAGFITRSTACGLLGSPTWSRLSKQTPMREDHITVSIQTHSKQSARFGIQILFCSVHCQYLCPFCFGNCKSCIFLFSFFGRSTEVNFICRIILCFIMICWKRNQLYPNINIPLSISLSVSLFFFFTPSFSFLISNINMSFLAVKFL